VPIVPTDRPVREIMTPNPVTVRADTPIQEAAEVLANCRFGALPVVEDGEKLVGLLRDDDLIVQESQLHIPTTYELLGSVFQLPGARHRFEEELKKFAGNTVRDVMDDDPPTVRPDDTVEIVATVMHERSVTHIPVVDDGKVVGIVARGDLVRVLVADR
jgi:CBS domain-containing protein